MKLLPAFLLSHPWGAPHEGFSQFPQFPHPPLRWSAQSYAGSTHQALCCALSGPLLIFWAPVRGPWRLRRVASASSVAASRQNGWRDRGDRARRRWSARILSCPISGCSYEAKSTRNNESCFKDTAVANWVTETEAPPVRERPPVSSCGPR